MRAHSRLDMAMTTGVMTLAAVLSVASMASLTFAADFLTRDEVKKLVSGNTVHVEVSGKGKFKTYLNANGKAIRLHNGQALDGVWRVKENGALCVHYAGDEERCGTVKKNSDGTYTRIDDANVTNHWTKVSKGKDL
jgi:hypothetical protein